MPNSRVSASSVLGDRRALSTALVMAAVAAAVLPATALGQTTAGGNNLNSANVTVDLSVIDELGPRRSIPQLLLPTLPRTGPSERSTRARQRLGLQPRYAPRDYAPPALAQPGGAPDTQERIVLKPPDGVTRSRPRAATPPVPERSPAARTTPPPDEAERAPLRAAPPPPPPAIAGTPRATPPTPREAPRRVTPSNSAPAEPRQQQSARTDPPSPEPKPQAPPPPAARAPEPKPQTPPPAARAPEPPAPARPPAPSRESVGQPVKPPAPPVLTSRPPAPPPPAPAADRKPETQTAALPPATQPGSVASGSSFRITFDSGSARLGDDARKQIDVIAEALRKNENLRLQLFAFAVGGADAGNNPRRLSLSRALAVRSEFIEKGILGRRIDVRAEGDRYKDGPPDRVDMVVSTR